jgi:hypothetical protein
MSDVVHLEVDQYRLLVAVRYLNASEAIWKGLKRQRGVNDFHFLISMRSFIEYTRRGVWFLVWASEKELMKAEDLTFKDSGSPKLATMDAMLNEALGQGKTSPLMNKVQGVNEPFLNCLHALTHGNPLSVRMTGIGLDKIFNTEKLLAKAELELDIFRVLVYRRMMDEDSNAVWATLSPICNRPVEVKANALIAAKLLQQSGKTIQS